MESLAVDLNSLSRHFEEHRAKLLRMLENRIDVSLRRRIDPEDVLADAFLKAQGRWARYCESKPISLYPWLHQQTMDALFEAWRRHDGAGRALHREMPWPEHSSAALAVGLFGSLTSASGALARTELAEKVRAALQMLKAEYREVLLLRHFDGLTNVEAGEVLGVETAAAAKRYLRALKRFEEALRTIGVGREHVI